RAPARRPRHLLDLFADRRAHRGIADVGVNLHEEVAADDHGFGFRVVDIRGDDGAAARDLVAHELGRDERRNRRAEAMARMLPRHDLRKRLQHLVALDVLADGDELHLRGDSALARMVHLRDVGSDLGATRLAFERKAHPGERRVAEAHPPIRGGELGELGRVAALFDPARAQRGQPRADVDLRSRIAVWARGVVHDDRRILFGTEGSGRIRLGDLAHRHADIAARTRDVDLFRMGQRLHRRVVDASVACEKSIVGVHEAPLQHMSRETQGSGTGRYASLHRHYPYRYQGYALTIHAYRMEDP